MAICILPEALSGEWPAQVLQATNTLTQISKQAIEALQTQSDVLWLQFHSGSINHEAIPILHALETMANHGEVPLEWVLECSACFGIILRQLQDAQQTATGQWVLCWYMLYYSLISCRDTLPVGYIRPVDTVHSGKPGCPCK